MPATNTMERRAGPELRPAQKIAKSATRRRIGTLDGLRGVALAAVIGYHVAPSKVSGGFIGVEAFFVLSGYLLTALLLHEAENTGRIDKRRYAIRRVLRIGPALLLLLLGLVLVGPLAAPADVYRLRGDVISSLAGVTNWRLIADGSSYFNQVGRPPLVRHLWSIAVEIQFYALCPFLVGWLLRRKRFSAIAAVAGGLAASALLMAVLYRTPDPSRVYYGTDTRAGALLAGVLLGVLLGHRLPARSRARPEVWLQRSGLIALGGLGALVFFADEQSRFMYPGGFLLTQVATMVVIAAGLRHGAVAALLDRRPLRWLGERCYGIYLWHWPAVALVRPGLDVSWPPAATATVTLAIAVIMGALSFHFVESPLMGRPRRQRQRARHSAPRVLHPLVGPAAVSIGIVPVLFLAVRLPSTNPIAESLKEGQRVVELQKEPARLLLTAVPTGPAPPPGPTSGGLPGPVTAIGDSVMVGAAGALQEKLGPGGFIEAKLRRHFSEGIETARQLKQEGRLGGVTIVHLGNNGPVKRSQMDALMAELAGPRNVLLVTTRVGRPWSDSVNQTFREAAARYPSVRMVDWQDFSAGHPDWFHSDGAHLKPTGARAYSELIAGVLATLPPPPAPQPPPAHAPAPPPAAPQVAAPPPAAPGAPPPAEVPTILLGA